MAILLMLVKFPKQNTPVSYLPPNIQHLFTRGKIAYSTQVNHDLT